MSTISNSRARQFEREDLDEHAPIRTNAGFTTSNQSLIVKNGKSGAWILADEDSWIDFDHL